MIDPMAIENISSMSVKPRECKLRKFMECGCGNRVSCVSPAERGRILDGDPHLFHGRGAVIGGGRAGTHRGDVADGFPIEFPRPVLIERLGEFADRSAIRGKRECPDLAVGRKRLTSGCRGEILGTPVARGADFIHADGHHPGAAGFRLGGDAAFSGLGKARENQGNGNGQHADGDHRLDQGGATQAWIAVDGGRSSVDAVGAGGDAADFQAILGDGVGAAAAVRCGHSVAIATFGDAQCHRCGTRRNWSPPRGVKTIA